MGLNGVLSPSHTDEGRKNMIMCFLLFCSMGMEQSRRGVRLGDALFSVFFRKKGRAQRPIFLSVDLCVAIIASFLGLC